MPAPSRAPARDLQLSARLPVGGDAVARRAANDFIGKLTRSYFIPRDGLDTVDASEFYNPAFHKQVARTDALPTTDPQVTDVTWARFDDGDLGSPRGAPSQVDVVSRRVMRPSLRPGGGVARSAQDSVGGWLYRRVHSRPRLERRVEGVLQRSIDHRVLPAESSASQRGDGNGRVPKHMSGAGRVERPPLRCENPGVGVDAVAHWGGSSSPNISVARGPWTCGTSDCCFERVGQVHNLAGPHRRPRSQRPEVLVAGSSER